MSGYCPVCGVYCEEDDDRVCAACKSEKKNHYCPECAAKWADEAFAAVRMVKADEIDRLTRENADLRAKLADAEKARGEQAEALRQAVASCKCLGTGKWQTSCSLCGDSTFDHHCNDEIVDCDRAWCITARSSCTQRT